MMRCLTTRAGCGFLLMVGLWANAAAQGADVEAIAGDPFGVAEVTVPFPAQDVGAATGRTALDVHTADGRVLYPSFGESFLKRILGGSAPPPAFLTVMFLFRGDGPLDVTISTPTPQTVRVVPTRRPPLAHTRMLRRWWRNYSALFRELEQHGDHPPIVETYLSSMLARRLGLAAPLVDRLKRDEKKTEGRLTLELLTGAESMRMEVLRSSSLGVAVNDGEAAFALPSAVAWRRPVLPPVEGDVDIEPMAMRVPEECFYVRFGQYANFLWLNALLEDYGGDIGKMFFARGYRANITKKVEDQLAMEQGVLAELLGPQAIADVAMIGMDTLTREGAAIGAIFEARNGLLGVDLVRQRHEALFREKDRGATLTTVNIAGRDVSYLATPDNRLRSYYAIDGNYHLVTNTKAMVERFFAVAEGERPLGASAEFRHARSAVPVSRDDTIFVYFSSPFFQNLMSPQYQIELRRRMQAVTDLELITLATLAARTEGKPADTLDALIDADLLPAGFGHRPDHSSADVAGERLHDSLRGARGYFTPVPDVPVSSVSSSERDRYAEQATYYAENWRQMDPLLIAIKRFALDKTGRERIAIDAVISPLDDTKYSWFMTSLGEPSQHELVPPTDNIIAIEAALRGGLLFPRVPPHTLFVGVQDHEPLAAPSSDEILRLLSIIRTTPGYLGAWPKPGFLDFLPFGLGGTADAQGYSELPLGILRWQGRGFSVLSMDEALLSGAAEQIGFVEADEPAQVRMRVGNLSAAKFGGWLNALSYERARQVSVGNASFLSILTQQLDVPPEQARAVAHQLLDADLVCALGGEYERTDGEEPGIWRSTGWPPSLRYELPEDYVAPLMTWFRGLEAQLVKHPNRLVLRGYIDMQRKERDALINLPFFGEAAKDAPAAGADKDK